MALYVSALPTRLSAPTKCITFKSDFPQHWIDWLTDWLRDRQTDSTSLSFRFNFLCGVAYSNDNLFVYFAQPSYSKRPQNYSALHCDFPCHRTIMAQASFKISVFTWPVPLPHNGSSHSHSTAAEPSIDICSSICVTSAYYYWISAFHISKCS